MNSLRAFFQQFTNAFGTIALVCAGITGWLTQQGCISTGDLLATCSISWLPTSIMPYVTGAFIVLTLVGKAVRPGGLLHSMLGGTAVVSPTPSVGTVTPSQVKSPQ